MFGQKKRDNILLEIAVAVVDHGDRMAKMTPDRVTLALMRTTGIQLGRGVGMIVSQRVPKANEVDSE